MRVFQLSFLLIGILAAHAKADINLVGGSYSQDFNSIGDGLPIGVTVRTNATSSSLGTTSSFQTGKKNWNSNDSGFHNYAANDSIALGSNSDVQNGSRDRALGVHIKGDSSGATLGLDPGAAFTFRFTNTLGASAFNFSFSSQLLHDHNLALPNQWNVRWAGGDAPVSFTSIDTFSQSAIGSQNRSYQLSGAFANSAEVRWIQIVAEPSGGTSNGGDRHSFAIDKLSLSAVPEPGALALLGFVGFGLGTLKKFRSSRGRKTNAS
jgi:hypothetical protein